MGLENNPDIKSSLLNNYPDFFDVIYPAIRAKADSFFTPERLEIIQLLTEMTYNDQRVRTDMSVSSWQDISHLDDDERREVLQLRSYYSNRMIQMDSINRVKFLEIVEKHGFPNKRMFGIRDLDLDLGVRVMILHFEKDLEFPDMIERFVRMGEACPRLYGSFVDRKMGIQGKPFIYWTISNVTYDEVYDVENVDNRRLAIGMPTREQEKRREELIWQRVSAIGHDFVAVGYYQLIYQADIAYLEGNPWLSFALLGLANRVSDPLINQFLYRELELYAWLLIRNGQYEEAFYYMEYLAVNYGQHPNFIIRRFNENPEIKSRFLDNNPDFFEVTFPALMAKYESFYTPERLEIIQLLNEMTYNSQRVRTLQEGQEELDFEKMYEVNNINRIMFLEIVEKHGFPNERLFGSRDFLTPAVQGMIVNFFECKEVQELLLHYVRRGDAAPSLYGAFVDVRKNVAGEKLYFGIFSNVTDDRIYDVENVDTRRLAIGMPTREQERRRNELLDDRR